MRAMADANLKTAKKGVDIKLIYPQGSEVPDEYTKKKGIPINIRLIDDVRLSLKLNEKTAGIALPDLNGKIAYDFALMSEDPQFLRWSNLLFDYFWQKGRTVL